MLCHAEELIQLSWAGLHEHERLKVLLQAPAAVLHGLTREIRKPDLICCMTWPKLDPSIQMPAHLLLTQRSKRGGGTK